MILDLILPLVTGNEVYEKMQSDPRLAKIPVVVSTSDPSRAPSGVPIVKKPIDLDRLLGAIERHCQGDSPDPRRTVMRPDGSTST